MHEIPNLPFPSLHEPEQQPSQTAGTEPAFKAAETEAEETLSADSQG